MFATIFSILAGAAEDPAAAEAALREQLKDIPEGAIAAEINNDVARRLMHALSSFVYDGAAVQPDALRVAAELLARIALSGEEEPLASLKNAGLEEFVVKVRAARARARREKFFSGMPDGVLHARARARRRHRHSRTSRCAARRRRATRAPPGRSRPSSAS
jgi:hypothetical protein